MGSRTQPQPPLPKLDALGEDFAQFHARFASLFVRSEPRRTTAGYLRALMGPVERRNGWQLAEALGERRPDAVQRLLYHATWSAADARNRLMDFVVEQFGDPEAIGVLDDTGFVKKGTASVGVARQYCPPLGKVENCQVGVFLGYASPRGAVLLDRALYVPKVWCDDLVRRARVHVPERVRFHTKGQLALRLLRRAWRREVPMTWIVADEAYGNAIRFRDAIDAAERRYVLAVSSTTRVWTLRPRVLPPGPNDQPRRGRPRRRDRLAPEAPPRVTVADIVASWPVSHWHRRAVHAGEKGPITYDWACARVVERRRGLPANESWLLARRSIANPSEVAYFLSNAGVATTLEMLAHVVSSRYSIEQCFEETKDDLGLDQYEVRTWAGWHRHVTLTMMSFAWLVSVRSRLADPESPLARATRIERLHERQPPAPPWAPGKKTAWPLRGLLERRPSRRGRFRKSVAWSS